MVPALLLLALLLLAHFLLLPLARRQPLPLNSFALLALCVRLCRRRLVRSYFLGELCGLL